MTTLGKMTREQAKQRMSDIEQRFKLEKDALFLEVFQQRTYPDGCRVRRIRYNDDGSVFDLVTGTVVGAGVYLYGFKFENAQFDGFPNIQYWVRVETPTDYNSHQQCNTYGLELGKAEDFWEGDQRWSILPELEQLP